MSEMVVMECGHHILLRKPLPVNGQVVLCSRCDNYRKVVGQPPEISIRCQFKGCRFSRRFGRDLNEARRRASKHAMQRGPHTVLIRDGTIELERIGWESDTLPFEPVISERLALVREMQTSLKRFARSSHSCRNPTGCSVCKSEAV